VMWESAAALLHDVARYTDQSALHTQCDRLGSRSASSFERIEATWNWPYAADPSFHAMVLLAAPSASSGGPPTRAA